MFPQCFVDRKDRNRNIQIEQWRVENEFLALQNLNLNAEIQERNSMQVAKHIRNIYENYFMKEGSVPWQWDKLREYQKN